MVVVVVGLVRARFGVFNVKGKGNGSKSWVGPCDIQGQQTVFRGPPKNLQDMPEIQCTQKVANKLCAQFLGPTLSVL